MNYREITSAPGDRFRLPSSHPFMVELLLDPADWHNFQRLFADEPAVRILGHDDPQDGNMIVYTACASRETQRHLQDGWG